MTWIEEISHIKKELKEFREYVDEMEKTETVEWRKIKPFVIDAIERLEKRVLELEKFVA